jgi:hypothetical protein
MGAPTLHFAGAAGGNAQPDQQPPAAGEKNIFPSHRLNGTFFPLKWAHCELVTLIVFYTTKHNSYCI